MTCDETIHATAVSLTLSNQPWLAVAVDQPGVAVLLRGVSGSGKSDLALRLMAGHGASLIADDRVALTTQSQQVICHAPAAIAGLLEVRGLGLLRVAPAPPTALALVIDLVARGEVERLPAPDSIAL